jgi:hypothetical protein
MTTTCPPESTAPTIVATRAATRLAPLSLIALLALAACAIPLAFHDPFAYQRLCDLKIECLDVVERAERGSWNGALAGDAHAARLGLRKLIEYELGQGAGNAETAKQVVDVYGLFADDLDEFTQGDVAGRLGPGYAAEAKRQLSEAFDIAIHTEAAKNREPR